MILVTGAAGLSGSMVVAEFARQNIPVRALVRDRARAARLASLPGVEIVEGDMLQPETLGPAFDGVERVLMISSARERMVETQCRFIDAAKAAGVPYILKFSGKESGVGFRAENFRSMQEHVDIERYLEVSGLAWTQLRPSQFMQFYLPVVPTGLTAADATLYLPMNDARLSPVDVADIAQVAVAILTGDGHEGQYYEMTGPEALTMTEVAERLTEALGKPIRYVNVTLDEKRQMLLAAGLPPERAEVLIGLMSERSKWTESRVYLGTHERFGVRPTTFLEFAKRSAAAFLAEPARP